MTTSQQTLTLSTLPNAHTHTDDQTSGAGRDLTQVANEQPSSSGCARSASLPGLLNWLASLLLLLLWASRGWLAERPAPCLAQ